MRADAEAKAPVADKLSAYLAVLKREAEVYGADEAKNAAKKV